MSDILSAKIEITVEMLDTLRNQIREAEDRAVKAEKETARVAALDVTERIPRLLDTVAMALPIVQFAIGNLDPATRGWPYRELFNLGKLLLETPGVTQTVREFAMEYQAVSREMESHAKNRQAVGGAVTEAPKPMAVIEEK